jgi:hypothetical protein
MRRLLAVTFAAVAAGCGGSNQAMFDSGQVERAFQEQGFALRRLASNGAEQTAMGTTSRCATSYWGRANLSVIAVWVCDSPRDARQLPLERVFVRSNVVVEILQGNRQVRGRIDRALDGLD